MRGEMYLELHGIGGYDHATRICDPVVLPLKTKVWVTADHNALVVGYGMRIGGTRARDVLEIYVNSTHADQGFADKKDSAAVAAYLLGLTAKGWSLQKRKQ